MPRTPRAERTCLVCDVTFTGTPKATRCKPCRDAGISVPDAKQRSQPRKAPVERLDLPQHEKTCQACGSDFTTHKARVARCNECIVNGRPVPKRTCLECKRLFTLTDDSHINCPECADLLGVPQFEMSVDQQAKAAEAENLSRHQDRLAAQKAWLDHRAKPPKEHPNMTQRTSKTPLGILWLQLCAADGAASSLLYAAAISELDEDGKVTLMTTFYRLRAKGYHPSAISKLCPKAILKQAAQDALQDLPKVTEPNPTSQSDWDRVATAASLGLSQQQTEQHHS